ncbi:hypothetical protein FMM49_11585 [Streptomyces rimosus subsp. rimosus]|nr:hypothetical protein FMM49_11585 [Streptomyces rimosus subsp. rimosus]
MQTRYGCRTPGGCAPRAGPAGARTRSDRRPGEPLRGHRTRGTRRRLRSRPCRDARHRSTPTARNACCPREIPSA